MGNFVAQPRITLQVECHDKDGNLKWTEQVVVEPEPQEKEPDNGERSND